MKKVEHLSAHDGVRIPLCRRPQEQHGAPLGTVILAHGITAEKSEGGIFDRQAQALNAAGFATVQFDFRGHGESELPSRQMTIAGEVDDLTSVIEAISDDHLFLVAASFGAVATCLLRPDIKRKMAALVLWNPVLSLERTFVRPELPWQLHNYGRQRIREGIERGKLSIDDSFEVGASFLKELSGPEPAGHLHEFECPILILHGDADTYVSFDYAAEAAAKLGNSAKFIRVPNSEHGFGRIEEEQLVIAETTAFILASL